MHCRNCNTNLPDRAVACTGCGMNPYAGTTYCPACGATTQPNAIVCLSCGIGLPRTSDPLGDLGTKKLVAGLCGILIGGLGIHKFVLGNNKPGIVMVAVSVCSLGFGYPIMHVIGLIEGIIYLTKSDAEFYQLYVVQKKEWF